MARNGRKIPAGTSSSTAAAALGLLLMLVVLVPACGVFDTRDPNPPEGGDQTPQQRQTEPEAVFFNFSSALAYQDQLLYEETLRENFEFVFDEVDRSYFETQGGGDVFDDWGVDAELSAIRLIFSESESLTVNFDVETTQESPDSALIRLDYRFRQRISGEEVVTYKGFADIHMRNDSGLWSIDRWEDKETSSVYFTWGRLKGNTVVGGSTTRK